MRWRPLSEFRNASVPKLDNLRRARDAGLRIPEPTFWIDVETVLASTATNPPCPPPDLPFPLIVRSASPHEDTTRTSNAGQFLSLPVEDAETWVSALTRVASAVAERSDAERPEGAIFVQEWIIAERAGVTFFDGFYFEETSAAGTNTDLTAGIARGDVRRGHLERGDARSRWLEKVHAVFGGRLDLEWCELAGGERVLLQVRPALFPVRRNETLSLANHKEILGDPPSPWMLGLLAEVGQGVMTYYSSVEPAVGVWNEPYAIELGERAWMNFSAFFRLMDHWGLPRTMVTDSIGGEFRSPRDRDVNLPRLLSKLPTMLRMAVKNLATVARIDRGFRTLDARLASASTLPELYAINVEALDFSIRTNFAIVQVLSVVSRARRLFGFRQAANVVTHRMMDRYAHLAALPTVEERLEALDAWLAEYGHRGPLESDPCQPRFAELREQLQASLSAGPAPLPPQRPQPRLLVALLGRVFFLCDEWRERFRDRLMRWWQQLRVRIVEEAEAATASGHLETSQDVFFLRREDLAADPATWAARASLRRERWERAAQWHLPTTASRDDIEAAIASNGAAESSEPGARVFRGIGLGAVVTCGTAVRGSDVAGLLARSALPDTAVLIAETLEPSWAVLFPRFAAVVADLGGELSHAAILLREAGIPAVMNAHGAFRGVQDGDLVEVDPIRGECRVVTPLRPLRTPQSASATAFNKTS